MTKENTSSTCERFPDDIEVVYNCGSCKHEKNSLFKEPCMSCHIDHERDDKKPTKYEPKLCSANTTDCEACKINI